MPPAADHAQAALDVSRAVARVPDGVRAEDVPDVQLALADAVATGRPDLVVLALTRSLLLARERAVSPPAWGLYTDRLRRTGVAHRGLSARCRLVLERLEAGDEAGALDAAASAYDVHGKRALWWFAHVLRDLRPSDLAPPPGFRG